jgi:hypothetical protein
MQNHAGITPQKTVAKKKKNARMKSTGRPWPSYCQRRTKVEKSPHYWTLFSISFQLWVVIYRKYLSLPKITTFSLVNVVLYRKFTAGKRLQGSR